MSDKPEIRPVIVQIKPPGDRDEGQVAEGRYVVADNVVTLTDRAGAPVRDSDGKTYSRKLSEGDNPHVIAGRLTKEFRLALLGKTKIKTGFSGPIAYPKTGVC